MGFRGPTSLYSSPVLRTLAACSGAFTKGGQCWDTNCFPLPERVPYYGKDSVSSMPSVTINNRIAKTHEALGSGLSRLAEMGGRRTVETALTHPQFPAFARHLPPFHNPTKVMGVKGAG